MIHALLASFVAVATSSANIDLLRSAIDPNPTLRSYISAATLSARAHAVPSVRRTFEGTAYYVRPKSRLVFRNVPAPLSHFRTLDTSTPSWEEATAQYTIGPLTDDGKLSSYELVPKKAGARVTSLVITVDDQAALITRAIWSYRDGETLTFEQQYETNGTYRVPSEIDISARFPGYSIDGIVRFSKYQNNADVPASVFDSPP